MELDRLKDDESIEKLSKEKLAHFSMFYVLEAMNRVVFLLSIKRIIKKFVLLKYI